MNNKDSFKIEGALHIKVIGENGEIKQEVKVKNAVKNAGLYGLLDQVLASPTVGKVTHMAVGTGTPGATALGTEADRNALSTKTRSNAVLTMVGDWAAGDGTGALTEAGLFDADASGNMWCSTTFAAINKGAADALQITWTITIS